jgi:hypothetical protein
VIGAGAGTGIGAIDGPGDGTDGARGAGGKRGT